MIKISIIIPVYNAQEYLEECIQSVQRQTLNEIELLCVNDGSTDDSLCVLKELQRKDKRIRVFTQSNQGAGVARNVALKNAEGEFICFMDADDYLLDYSALEKLYHCAVVQQEMICGGLFYMDLDSKIEGVDTYGKLRCNLENEKQARYIEYQYDYFYTNYIYSRKLLIDNHIMFPCYRRFEDPPFFARAMHAAETFYIVKVPFYCYRVNYKKINYNEDLMIDEMQGMIDNLLFSNQKGLKKLHRITYYRILEICGRELKKYVLEKNSSLLEKLIEANHVVNWGWVGEKSNINRQILKPLSYMQEDVSIRDSINRQENINKWIFPVKYLRRGSRIALYGAGDVGKSYFKQIQRDNDYILCAWIDQNFDKITGLDYEVSPPKRLTEINFDFIVIAVVDMMIAMDIMDYLGELEVPAYKIVWDIER